MRGKSAPAASGVVGETGKASIAVARGRPGSDRRSTEAVVVNRESKLVVIIAFVVCLVVAVLI
ncbi:MAG: hypothetical protein AAFU70_06240, partial [Planctomycetota bacterium]